MKKIIISIFMVVLLFSNSVSALGAEFKFRVKPFELGEYVLTNPNPENPIVYVLLTDLRVALTKQNYDNFFEEILTHNKFDKLEINLEEYAVKSAKNYHPNNFDFSLDNVIRNITLYSKTQDDFDRFYYRPLNNQQGISHVIIEGALRGGFNFDYVKKNATYDLRKYLKVPNSEEALGQLYPKLKGNSEFLDFAKGNTKFNDTGTYEGSHLYNYSVIIELEKKEEIQEELEDKINTEVFTDERELYKETGLQLETIFLDDRDGFVYEDGLDREIILISVVETYLRNLVIPEDDVLFNKQFRIRSNDEDFVHVEEMIFTKEKPYHITRIPIYVEPGNKPAYAMIEYDKAKYDTKELTVTNYYDRNAYGMLPRNPYTPGLKSFDKSLDYFPWELIEDQTGIIRATESWPWQSRD